MNTMRYSNPSRKYGSWEAAEKHWFAIGWHPLDEIEERECIAAVWEAKFGTKYGRWGADADIPPPSRCWDIVALSGLGERGSEIAAEFQTKLLAAFRRCVPKGERLLAIGHWQLSWYDFDPHGGIDASNHDEWATSILPHDASHFVSRDLSFGTYGDYRGKITIFGQELLDALDQDPPTRFAGLCRPCGPLVTQRSESLE